MAIEYDRMRRSMPGLKRRLTLALKSGEPERVIEACRAAVREWDACGAWPDDWARWQRALDDTYGWRVRAPRLEDL